MIDRKMIKWQPFDSVVHTKSVVKELIYNKEKIDKINLSEEQLFEIENNIKIAYRTKSIIFISYIYSGNLMNFKGTIKKIDLTQKKIVFYDKTILYFSQILKANL